jgi:hypothetical protein
MERTLISFNLPNLVSIVLMAALGYGLLALVASMVKGQAPMVAGTAAY